jgi:hypothetical protein
MNNLHYLFKAIPWLGFFAAITISWIYYLRARNKERIALIEKGVDVSEIYSTPIQPIKFPWLKLGIVLLGISIGISVVVVLIILYPDSQLAMMQAGAIAIISGFLFGSISMIIAHYIDKPKR